MAISYTQQAKFPLHEDGGYNWGAIINGVFEALDRGFELTFEAGQDISAGDCVALKSDGAIYKALCTDQTLTPAIGFAPYDIDEGDEGKVRGFGWIDVDTSWSAGADESWSPGEAVYVGDEPGRLSKVHQSWANYLGYAKSHTTADYTTRIFIEPRLRGNRLVDSLVIGSQAVFAAEVDNGQSGANKTIDWTAGNKQMVILTADCTFTFTAPKGPTNLVLRLVQDATGGRDPVWPAAVKWSGASEPGWTAAGNSVDIVCFYYDGNNYYGSDLLDVR